MTLFRKLISIVFTIETGGKEAARSGGGCPFRLSFSPPAGADSGAAFRKTPD
ncbi:MAG: hypothetical protein LBG72_07700 [Spirochaetaceae bacterium]|nr:hypothetical protein [Spirochaetaceae bacterium]